MSEDNLKNEQRIMIMMRKTLSGIIKDVTPMPGMRSPLRDETVENIRQCLGVISSREQEIAIAMGREIKDRPRFTDEPQKSHVVNFARPNGSTKNNDED